MNPDDLVIWWICLHRHLGVDFYCCEWKVDYWVDIKFGVHIHPLRMICNNFGKPLICHVAPSLPNCLVCDQIPAGLDYQLQNVSMLISVLNYLIQKVLTMSPLAGCLLDTNDQQMIIILAALYSLAEISHTDWLLLPYRPNGGRRRLEMDSFIFHSTMFFVPLPGWEKSRLERIINCKVLWIKILLYYMLHEQQGFHS